MFVQQLVGYAKREVFLFLRTTVYISDIQE